MKKLLRLAAVTLLIIVNAIAQSSGPNRGTDEGVRNRLIGAWRLAWLEEPAADGQIHRADCTGLLVYTRDGHISVQVMYRDPQPGTNTAHVQYAQGGYEASFGTYKVDDAHTFTFHVEGALVRTLVGKDLKRVYELSGDQLIVHSPDPNERWRVAWEHY